MNGHAVLAPSAAGRWVNCPGSVKAEAQRPDREHPRTKEGEAAHWVAETALRRARDGSEMACNDMLGVVAPNGLVVTQEMVDGAQVFVDDVLSVVKTAGERSLLLIEQRVEMPHIHPQNWGTLDCAVYLPARQAIFLWDYKHGHRGVPAVLNTQAIDYMAGLVHRFGLTGLDDQRITACIRIVQPFHYSGGGPVDEWVVGLSDLRPHWNALATAGAEATGPSPQRRTGWHCRDCKDLAFCPAARESQYALIDHVRIACESDTMPSEALSVEYELLQRGAKLIEARLSALEDELNARIRGGDGATGYTIEQGVGAPKWDAPEPAVKAFAQQFGVNPVREALVTPKQAEKLAPPELRAAFQGAMRSITRRDPTAAKLVRVQDSKTARAFQKPRES